MNFKNLKVEIATGVHPYSKFQNPIFQLKEIVDGEPPRLDTLKFDRFLCNFVEVW